MRTEESEGSFVVDRIKSPKGTSIAAPPSDFLISDCLHPTEVGGKKITITLFCETNVNPPALLSLLHLEYMSRFVGRPASFSTEPTSSLFASVHAPYSTPKLDSTGGSPLCALVCRPRFFSFRLN